MGMRTVVDADLPLHVPTDGDNARRIVRWGLRHVTASWGEVPGLKVDEAIHAYIAAEPLPSRGGRYKGVLHVSTDLYASLRRGWETRWPPVGSHGEPYLVPNQHGEYLLDRIHRDGIREWDFYGRTVEIPFTAKELRP
jgi:hypothetical protein